MKTFVKQAYIYGLSLFAIYAKQRIYAYHICAIYVKVTSYMYLI